MTGTQQQNDRRNPINLDNDRSSERKALNNKMFQIKFSTLGGGKYGSCGMSGRVGYESTKCP
jgi:hypothetical protein